MKQLPDKMTTGELYGPAMEIAHESEANEYLQSLVERRMRAGHGEQEAEQIELHNIGYYAGYYDATTGARVRRVFGARHPVYGNALEYSVHDIKSYTAATPPQREIQTQIENVSKNE